MLTLFVLTLWTLDASTPLERQGAGVDPGALVGRKGPAVVRCGGDLIGFAAESALWSSSTVTLKKNALAAKVKAEIASADRRADLAQLMLVALENADPGIVRANGQRLTTGNTVIEVTLSTQDAPISCEVQEVVVAPLPKDFDNPVLFRQMDWAGRPVAIVNLQYLKKQPKRTTQVCAISSAAPSFHEPLPSPLYAAFMEEVTKKQQKWFKQVLVTTSAAPADAFELQLPVVGSGSMSGFGYGKVMLVVFRVVNRKSGQVLTHARGFRKIGNNEEKDVRDFGGVIACL